MSLADTSILEVTEIPALWAPWFKDRSTWSAWFAFLKVLLGLPLTEADRIIAAECLGIAQLPAEPVTEAWLICGRRAGKSFVLALIAAFLARFVDWRPYLSPGEVGTIKVMAVDRRQARTIWRYANALLTTPPVLAQDVVRSDDAAGIIELRNGVEIEVQTASFRSVRGYTVIAGLCDEIAFWLGDTSANPDTEILDALRPAMATVPGAMLLCASSPYARRGVLWQAYREHYGKPGNVLVWKSPTRTMNPTISEEFIAAAYKRDPAWAAAEYGAEFRTDIEGFVAREVIEALVEPGCYELPRQSQISTYLGFVDPSGGSSDSMTLAIGHTEGDDQDYRVLDLIREIRPPFSPESVVVEFAETLRSYGVETVYGDRYGGEWPAERFREHGIHYEPAEKTKSEIYRELLPLLNSRRCALLDHPQLINQFCRLERRTGRGTGRDSIDHPPGERDDIANAAAGVLTLAGQSPSMRAWQLLGRW